MHRSMRLIAIVAVLAAGLSTTGSAQAVTVDYEVQVGAIHPTQPSKPFEYTRYYPDHLQVRRGQTVQWNFVENLPLGFHTVTFWPSDPAGFWRPDDLPDNYAFPEEGWFDSGCGRGQKPTCMMTSTPELIGSGSPTNAPMFAPFRVTFDLPEGSYDYFCAIHPEMKGTIEVVGDATTLPSQSDIDDLVRDEIAADTANAEALFQARNVGRSVMEDGQRVWIVYLGDSTDDDHVSIDTYLPSSLDEVSPGDKVRFEFRPRPGDPIQNEIHTVTFPSEIGVHGIAFAFYPACDPDHPASGAKGIPGAWGVEGPPCPFNTEFLWQPRVTSPTAAPGNLVLPPATFHDSGALLPPGAPAAFRRLPDTGRTLPSSFEAEFPQAGTFTFACNIHEAFMTGSITVT